MDAPAPVGLAAGVELAAERGRALGHPTQPVAGAWLDLAAHRRQRSTVVVDGDVDGVAAHLDRDARPLGTYR